VRTEKENFFFYKKTNMRGRSRIENLRTKFYYLFPRRNHREMFLHIRWHPTGDLFS
jgi:hypothetical protein